MQIDATEQPTPRSTEWLAGWASATTTARSQVEVAQGERDSARLWAAGWRRAAQKYRLWWAASRDTLGDLMHEHADTVNLLKALYAYAGGPSFEQPDGAGLVPGMDRGTLGDVFKALWPEGKAK